MSGRTVISVRELGKRYRLGESVSAKGTLRDSLASGAQRLFRRSNEGKPSASDFWALKEVSFDVAEGEVLGIIGANGAGKSTLLKILSQITEPTDGEVRVRGRVASLLEVGTGFHPELSGRENVFMNGAILGMSQVEIRRKFDEIVEFAGVDQFIDTPVKRYSSGMLVRLGFAVAAHLDPEILVIDEVLAVGDEAFQRKCTRKIGEVSTSGRTILFVSHNMAAVEALCSRVVVLRNGKRAFDGSVLPAIDAYRNQSQAPRASVDLTAHAGRPKRCRPLMTRASVMGASDRPMVAVHPGETLTFVVEYSDLDREISPVLGVVLKSSLQVPVLGVDNRVIGGFRFDRTKAPGRISCTLRDLPLMPGFYSVDFYFGDEVSSLDVVHSALTFEVQTTDVYGTGKLPNPGSGVLLWPASWHCDSGTDADIRNVS